MKRVHKSGLLLMVLTALLAVPSYSTHSRMASSCFLDVVRATRAGVDFGDCTSRGQVEGTTPAHSVVKVWLDRKALWLTDADCGCSCGVVGTEQSEIGTCVGGTFALTAPTEAIQAFVKKHATDEKVLRKGDDFRLRVGNSGVSR
jgi:hypothetical protein